MHTRTNGHVACVGQRVWHIGSESSVAEISLEVKPETEASPKHVYRSDMRQPLGTVQEQHTLDEQGAGALNDCFIVTFVGNEVISKSMSSFFVQIYIYIYMYIQQFITLTFSPRDKTTTAGSRSIMRRDVGCWESRRIKDAYSYGRVSW